MDIVDSHVHFWDRDHLTYDWIKGKDVLDRSYLPDDFRTANGEHNVQAIAFVEAACSPEQNIAEVEWVETLDAPIRAIVAFVPLERKDGRAEILERFSDRPLVRSIRRIYQHEEVGFARQSDFISGVKMLKDYDLSFDICIKSRHLDETIELVRQIPDVPFILNHIAKPDIAGGEFEPWTGKLKTLAGFENIVCKISGVITEADHTNWTPEQMKPYILETIEAFGIDRVMFGSDWPVVNLAGSYTAWVDTLLHAVGGLSDGEKTKLFVDNAIRFYRMTL